MPMNTKEIRATISLARSVLLDHVAYVVEGSTAINEAGLRDRNTLVDALDGVDELTTLGLASIDDYANLIEGFVALLAAYGQAIDEVDRLEALLNPQDAA